MEDWIIGLAFFFAGFFLIWYANIFISISYLKNPGNHDLKISLLLFRRLKIYTFRIAPDTLLKDSVSERKADEMVSNPPEKGEKEPSDSGNWKMDSKILGKIANSLYFEKVYLKMIYGFEDAALTGMSAGILAALKEILVLILNRRFKIKKAPEFFLAPVYGNDRLEVEFRCIFAIRLGNVISIAASMVKRPKFMRGGENWWLNTLSKT